VVRRDARHAIPVPIIIIAIIIVTIVIAATALTNIASHPRARDGSHRRAQ